MVNRVHRSNMSEESLEKPCPPADDDCCGGGACNPCVWDHYYAELQKWRIRQSELKAQSEIDASQ